MHPRDSLATQSDFAKKSLPALYHFGRIFQICPIIMTYLNRTIITRNLYTFYPILTAVYIVEQLVLQTMYISTKQEISKIIGHHLWIFPKPKMAHNIWTKVEDSCNSDIYEVGFIA